MWISRDPIEEWATRNVYCVFRNSPFVYYDYMGQEDQRVDGGNVSPPPPMASQPAIDKTQACCRYEATTYSEGVSHTPVANTRKYERTEKCPDNSPNPESCCCACGIKTLWGTMQQTSLIKASWGKCCACRVERRRVPVTSMDSPLVQIFKTSHTAVFVKCSDGRRWFMDHAGKDGRPVTGHTDDWSDMKDAAWSGLISRYPVVQDSACVACDDVDKLIKYSDSKDGKNYNGWQDCYWFGRGCMNKARDLIQSDGNCPSLP